MSDEYSVDQIAKRCALATCCVSGEYPTGLAGRRCVLSHPMFLRSTIHLGLVGEMHMHTGKNTPTLQDGEGKKKRTATRGCRGRVDSCLPEIWSWQRSCRRRLADQGSSDSSSSGVVAGRRESLEPTTARRVCAACDRTRFSPGPGAGGLWPAFLGSQPRRRPRRLVPAGKEEVAGAGSRAS